MPVAATAIAAAACTAKHYLAARIAVGTIDQALMAGLQVKHAHLRAAVVSRALLRGALVSYDLVRQLHPDAPAALGARVRHMPTGREDYVVPAVPGLGAALRVKFDGDAVPSSIAPKSLTFAVAAIVSFRRPS